MNFMHWMQRIHRPAARRRCIDEGHRLPQPRYRVPKTARFYPSQLCNSYSTGSSRAIQLRFPNARRIGDADRIYAWSTAGVIPPKSENASTYYRRSPYGGVQVLYQPAVKVAG